MQRLEVSCAVRRLNRSLGFKWLTYYTYTPVYILSYIASSHYRLFLLFFQPW